MTVLTVEHLSVFFGPHKAVENISLQVHENESIGIIGKSGCGKTAAVHAIARISTGTVSGKIGLTEGRIGFVFQEPMTSLNPTMKIGKQIAEGLIYHKLASRKNAKEQAIKLLEMVQIDNPRERFDQYPHELSGGMRQRVLIAIALALKPTLLIADEPTTALDVVTQLEILQLLKSFRKSMIIISHDFRVISALCDTVYVMDAGQFVESGPVHAVLNNPQHSLTQMLIQSVTKKK